MNRFIKGFILAIVGLLVLTACGETATPTNVVTTTAAPASSPTQAPPTVTQVAPTTVASTNSKLAELWATIPQVSNSTGILIYNNYAKLKEIYGVAPNQKLSDFVKTEKSQNFYRHLYPSAAIRLENAALDLKSTIGFDYFDIEQDAGFGESPRTLSVFKGNFDAAAIKEAYGTAKAQTVKFGNYDGYALEKMDLQNPIQHLFLMNYNNLALMSDKKLLALSSDRQTIQNVTNLQIGANATSIVQQPTIAAFVKEFGDPLSVMLSDKFSPAALRDVVIPSLSIEEARKKAEEHANLKLPKAQLAGWAYNETEAGSGEYLMAVFYFNTADAQAAVPVLENILKSGTTINKRPFSDFFTVTTAQAKGNLAVFKVKPQPKRSLLELFLQRDLPIFWQ